jgi:hypothetical protein
MDKKNINEKGFIEEVGLMIGGLFFLILLFSAFFVRFQSSQSVVSGIVYNTRTNNAISGNTTFAVRASVDTYVNQSNESDFCLPPHSPYEALVKKAAADKSVKVIITAHKYFALQSPITCRANVIVTQVK